MTLELYILRQLLIGLAFSVGGMAFIAVPGVLVNAVHKLSGVGMTAVLGFIPLVMVDLVPYLIPLGFLLALVAVYGRLAADNEWTAIRMAGIHPFKIVRPALVVAIVLSGALYFLVSEVSPQSTFRRRYYMKNSVTRMLKKLNPGRTEIKHEGFYLSARERDPENRNRFEQVFIHMPPQGDDPARTVYAQSAEFSFDGKMMRVDLVWPRFVGFADTIRSGNLQIECDLDQLFGAQSSEQLKWKYQSSGELRRRIANTDSRLAEEGEEALAAAPRTENHVPLEDLRIARYELHARESLSAVCPMFLLLGIPTGLLLRRGSQLGALACAVGYALVYYLLSMRLGKGLALSTDLPAWLAAWGTTLIGTLAGTVLTWVALRR